MSTPIAVGLFLAVTGCSPSVPVTPSRGSQPATSNATLNRLPSAVASAATGLPATMSAQPSTPSPVDTGVQVYGNCTTPSVEPTEIVLTCADYGEVLEDLNWTSWTSTSATAVGTLVYNDCTPNCAQGHYHDVADTEVTLTVPVRGASGGLVWSEVQENPEPPGYAMGPYHGAPQPLPTRPD